MEAKELIKYLGERMGMEDLALNDDGACSLIVEDHVHVDFEYIEEKNVLVMHSELGSTIEHDAKGRESIYVSLLSANLLGTHTGGGTMGLDIETGSVFLFRRFTCDTTSGDMFWDSFQDFIEAAMQWTDLFDSGSFEEVNDEDDLDEDSDLNDKDFDEETPAADATPPEAAASAPTEPSTLAMSQFQKV